MSGPIAASAVIEARRAERALRPMPTRLAPPAYRTGRIFAPEKWHSVATWAEKWSKLSDSEPPLYSLSRQRHRRIERALAFERVDGAAKGRAVARRDRRLSARIVGNNLARGDR